jgi:hypothetical protein
MNAAKHHVVRAVRATKAPTQGKMAAAAAASSKDDAMNDKNDDGDDDFERHDSSVKKTKHW